MARARNRRAFLWFVICLVLAGCGDGPSAPPAPEPKQSKLDGEWRGKVDDANLYLRLTEGPAGTFVVGTGSISVIPTFISLRVESSTYAHPNLTIVLTSPGYQPLTFTGQRMKDGVLKGKVVGSGYNDETVTLTRE